MQDAVEDAAADVQSLENAKSNGRNILRQAYQLVEDFYHQLDCDQKISLIHLHDVAREPVNDRNILLYLASIESRVQQLLPMGKTRRKSGRAGHSHIDETTISWRIDHPHHHDSGHHGSSDQHPFHRTHHRLPNLDRLDGITPEIPT